MEKDVALVIFDIGGYTEFIRNNAATLSHAHDAISTLLEHIADNSDHPLTLNKFEGDAALMYADVAGDPQGAARDVSAQVFAIFPKFKAQVQAMAGERRVCPCGACQNIGNLRLKAVIHLGKAAFRKIRQFEEMAGEDVIIVHRLLKNTVPAREYVLASQRFADLLDVNVRSQARPHTERYDHIGDVKLSLFSIT